ncbi:hypothetical protein F511_29799 [Dorcoceras hygrometricum]|uniref:Dystroglycan-like n=1 Tax=Dorcoceras hygrometricum TaxID=472368 RepID=A0A2Z7BWM0_9LAMI|nr:hypothetical protein F511_29799 [Dorcoceras hygrometricum]
MASSYISNALQLNVDSVLEITDNAEMVSMFKTLESTGLRGFLGFPSVLYERKLEQFFDTCMVKYGDITCEVSGKVVVISEDRFAGVFGLPTEGFINLFEVPKDLVYDARSIFSQSGEPISTYGKKRLMKYEYRFLNDILAKSITMKAGSFDSVTHGRFLMMTAIHFGIQVNWRKILFGILKEMVDKTLKKAKGFAAQLCVLLKGDPTVTMGEATTFPPLKILSAKTVKTYIATNETIDARGKSDEPDVAKIARSKKRPIATDDEPAEAIPLQTFEPSTAVSVEKRAAVEEAVGEQSVEPTADIIEREAVSTADEFDSVIAQAVVKADEVEHWFNFSYEEFAARKADRLIESASETDGEQETVAYGTVEQIHFEQIRLKYDEDKLRDILLMHIRDLERQFSGRFDEQDGAYRAFLNNICKYIHDQNTLLSLDVLTSQQKLSTQVTAVALDNADIINEVKEQRSILTNLDGQVATVHSELLDFRAKAKENHLNLPTQLGFLVDYINRGGDAKKGEGAVAADLNRLLMIKVDPVGEVEADQTW